MTLCHDPAWRPGLPHLVLLAAALHGLVRARVVAGEGERPVRGPLAGAAGRRLGGVDVQAGDVLPPTPLRALGVLVAVHLLIGEATYYQLWKGQGNYPTNIASVHIVMGCPNARAVF